MLYLTCTTITSVDLAHYGVSRAKDWVSVYCGTRQHLLGQRSETLVSRAKDWVSVYCGTRQHLLGQRSETLGLYNLRLLPAACPLEGYSTVIFLCTPFRRLFNRHFSLHAKMSTAVSCN